jgi:hypothetical protein
MKWPDGTPKSQNNAFDWRSTAGLSMASAQVGINNGKNTSSVNGKLSHIQRQKNDSRLFHSTENRLS